ncbi:MAG TPA: hypothetical protein VKL19_05090 [Thermoanaerobaculia bacterium]|nr:hypothetical protein [Thermoanaerobaculia bacterium]
MAFALIVIISSIAGMAGIVRRSSFVPQLAVVTGLVGMLMFDSNHSILGITGMVLSLFCIPLGVTYFVERRRRTAPPVGSVRPVADRLYLSDSGHWRFRES